MIDVGDCVTLDKLPEWVVQLPEHSQYVFQYCVGNTYPVAEIDQNGLFVLDVSKDVDKRFGGFMNDIRVEGRYITKVSDF